MTISDVQKTLESLGYTTKLDTKSRIAIVTDKRQAALNHVQEIYKTMDPRVLKGAASLRISSLGIVQVGTTVSNARTGTYPYDFITGRRSTEI